LPGSHALEGVELHLHIELESNKFN
jgi:hypothetical protein